jgi:hypothetical protein
MNAKCGAATILMSAVFTLGAGMAAAQQDGGTIPRPKPQPKPSVTAAELVHKVLDVTPDLNALALDDKVVILACGDKEDADKLWSVLKDHQTTVPGVVIKATASVIQVAVSADAQNARIADFIVYMKTPLADKDIPAVGFVFKRQPAAELDGTYDSYSQVPATAATPQAVLIVLKNGFIQTEKIGQEDRAVPKRVPQVFYIPGNPQKS